MKIRKSQTKKFCNIGPWCQCYKTYYDINLLMFVIRFISYVRPYEAFPAWAFV